VEQAGGEANRGQEEDAVVRAPHLDQCQARAQGQEDVADLTDAAEGEESLGLILAQRLRGADEQGRRPEARND